MFTILIILGVTVAIVIWLGFVAVNRRRPKFFRGRLKPLEKSLYQELARKLPPAAAKRMTEQLSYLRRGVRCYYPKSYTLELFDDAERPLPKEVRFERADAYTVATVHFTMGQIKYKAEMAAAQGRVSGITVRPNPKAILFTSMKEPDRFRLNNDSMEKGEIETSTDYFPPDSPFDGRLGALAAEHVVREVRRPLAEEQWKQLLRRSDTRFPDDWIDLFRQTNGFMLDNCQVFGWGAMEDLSLEDGTYRMLAEKASGCLAIRKIKKRTEIKYFSYNGDAEGKVLGDNFLTALANFLSIE